MTEVQRNRVPHLQQTEVHYSFKALHYLRDKYGRASEAAALCGRYNVAPEHLKDFKAHYIVPVRIYN